MVNVEPVCFMHQERVCIRVCGHCVSHACPNQPNTRCNCAPGECGATEQDGGHE